MKTRPASTALAVALVTVMTLLAAAPANADAVRRQQLDEAANARLASGFSISIAGNNLKETSGLSLKSRWGYDSSWNRYSYVRNNPLKFVDPNGEFAVLAALKIYAAKIALNAGVGAVAKVGTDFTINMMKNPGNLVERAQAAHSQMDYGKSAKDGAIIGAANGLVNGLGGVAAATALSYQDSQGSGNTSGESAEDAGLTALAATGGALTGQVLKAKAAQAGVGLATSGEPTGLLSTVSIIVVGGVVEAGLESLGTDLPEIIAPKNEPDINPPNPTPIEN